MFNLRKIPIFYSYDEKTDESKVLSHWENISQSNFNSSNFLFDASHHLKFYGNSIFVYEDYKFFTNIRYYENFYLKAENFLPSLKENFFIDETIFENYLVLRQSSFIGFFINNLIDVPICFKKSKSLKTKNFEFIFLKFTNLLMWDGKKEKIIRILLNAFFFFFYKLQQEKLKTQTWSFSWFEFFLFTNETIKILNKNDRREFCLEEPSDVCDLPYNNFFFKNEKMFENVFFIKNFINDKLSQLTPLFTYYIYNVDKNIRKYTRGKSGKYVFVWKYVAPYKRKFLMFRWFLKDIKFDDNREFPKRLIKMFEKLTFNLKGTYAWRAKNYTYTFIFKNFRKTFMSSLKTVAK